MSCLVVPLLFEKVSQALKTNTWLTGLNLKVKLVEGTMWDAGIDDLLCGLWHNFSLTSVNIVVVDYHAEIDSDTEDVRAVNIRPVDYRPELILDPVLSAAVRARQMLLKQIETMCVSCGPRNAAIIAQWSAMASVCQATRDPVLGSWFAGTTFRNQVMSFFLPAHCALTPRWPCLKDSALAVVPCGAPLRGPIQEASMACATCSNLQAERSTVEVLPMAETQEQQLPSME